ncbi:MAG TPA: sodium:solute symporter family protein [Vicinamibacteria bacterium]|jgi:Na+/proline symporter
MAPFEMTEQLTWMLGTTIVVYVAAMYALSLAVRSRIHDTEDFIVAGRRLPLSLAWATLLATWFGAGTILAVSEEVTRDGFRPAALDPLGAGFCLILAGLFFAKPLWEMGLLTLSDFFRRRFGPTAEILSACIMVPTYFGWVAAQLVALAGMLELFFGIDLPVGILLVAVVATGYTLLGGMWSVTLTDAVQIALVLVGLVVLAIAALGELGNGSAALGLLRLREETPPEMLELIPTDSLRSFLDWMALFCVGALGNIPGQDLMQRIFASKSAVVAKRASILAGVAYLTFGLIPIMLGFAARLLVPQEITRSILPALASLFLSPVLLVTFTVALISAVLSTIDSALLSPASVLSQNIFERFNTRQRIASLTLNRIAVLIVAAGSVGFAFLGESAYALLEDAYELPLVALFVPLTLGLKTRSVRERAAIASMLVGSGLWVIHYVAGWEHFFAPLTASWGVYLPVSLTATLFSFLAYLIANSGSRNQTDG